MPDTMGIPDHEGTLIVSGTPGFCQHDGEEEPHEWEASLLFNDDWSVPEYTGRTIASLELVAPCRDEIGIELSLQNAIDLRDRLASVIRAELLERTEWHDAP